MGSGSHFHPLFSLLLRGGSAVAWLPIATSISIPAVMATLEALKVALVFLIGLGLGASVFAYRKSVRVGVGAATFYSLIPATFLLNSGAMANSAIALAGDIMGSPGSPLLAAIDEARHMGSVHRSADTYYALIHR